MSVATEQTTPAASSELEHRIVRFLAEQPEPVRRGDVCQAVRGSRSGLLAALDELVAAGIVKEEPGPMNGRYVSIADSPDEPTTAEPVEDEPHAGEDEPEPWSPEHMADPPPDETDPASDEAREPWVPDRFRSNATFLAAWEHAQRKIGEQARVIGDLRRELETLRAQPDLQAQAAEHVAAIRAELAAVLLMDARVSGMEQTMAAVSEYLTAGKGAEA